jgi:DNA-binding HxlR family transcriptional regulator
VRAADSLQFLKHCANIEAGMASNPTCPVCRTAEVVCGKWTLLVIRDLAEGRSRFCELERSLAGISPRTLSLRLRALEEEGIVERQTFPEVPPRVEYALTDKGRALVPLIEQMRAYGRDWLCGRESSGRAELDREPAAALA